MNKGFFLDRDGIILKMVYDLENGRVHTALNAQEVNFVPGIFELLKETKKLGYKNVIISNQPNIGLKRINMDNFEKVRRKMANGLLENGIQLDEEYYCFHHPFAEIPEYKIKCDCRKPEPGLLLKAAKEHNIDLKKSFMTGDGVNDVIAGYKAGCQTILVANLLEAEHLRVMEERLNGVKPDYLVKNLREVARMLKGMKV